MATFKIEILPVTPLQIGSGEDLPGYNYYIEGDAWYVYRIEDLFALLDTTQRTALLEIAAVDIMALTERLSPFATAIKQCAYYRGTCSLGAAAAWRQAAQNHSQALARRFMHNGEGPYLPGSSLKGSLRTALLYGCMNPIASVPRERNPGANLESKTFRYPSNRISMDPLRFLKIGDSGTLASGSRLRTLTRWAYDEEKRGWKEEVPTVAECTACALETGVTATTILPAAMTLTIAEDSWRAAQYGEHSDFQFNVATLIAACRVFYGEHLMLERSYTKEQPALKAAYDALFQRLTKLPANAAMVRLGFGTGRSAVTVDDVLPEPAGSHSRLLADNRWPLGWAEMHVLMPDDRPFTTADDITFMQSTRCVSKRKLTGASKSQ